MEPSKTNSSGRILLIGWDAADWQVIDPMVEAGEMPVLARLIEEGVMGNLATLQPPVSPMLWNSIATGKTADKHGILGFTERDASGMPRPYSSLARKTKAIWNILQQALDWRCHVTNWWASHPAEPLDGVVVSNFFFHTHRVAPNTWRVPAESVHPSELAAELGPMRMGINEVNEHLVLPFIPNAAQIDQKSDNRLEKFAGVLSDCCAEQAIATSVLEHEPWQFAAVYSDAIDHFSHGFMTYHPPRLPHVPEEDFEMYKDVMKGVYRFHDLMLGRLLELAGPEATIILCSDHGFQSGVLRPFDNPREPAGPTFWHRDFGILVMKGPGIKRDERVYGANLLDIVPTILTLAGLPIGRDMDGKPLLEALDDPKPLPPISSWDEVPGRDGRHPPEKVWDISVEDAEDVIRHFAALGYVEGLTGDRLADGLNAQLESQYNLAQVHLSGGRPAAAVTILEELLRERPWETRYIHQLANAYLKGGWYRAARELLDRAYPPAETQTQVPFIVEQMRVKALLRLGEPAAANELIDRIMTHMPLHSSAWVEIGWLRLELRQRDKAEQCFRRALVLDPDSASAYQGLSTIYLRRHDNYRAIEYALDAVQRLHHLPVAHTNLGIALAREGRTEEAVIALRRAIGMDPQYIRAHRFLSALLTQEDRSDLRGGVHRNLALRFTRERAGKMPEAIARAAEVRATIAVLSATERAAREEEARPRPVGPETSGRTLTLVSGLPRSGTSLMMQMLQAGGLPAQTDEVRTADIDNPKGYYEWEAIKRLPRDPQVLDAPGLEGKAIKVVSALLNALPRVHRYRIIFMLRPIREIAISQAKMIEHRGTTGMADEEEKVAIALHRHLQSTLSFLLAQPETFRVLQVDYSSLIADARPAIARIAEFLGSESLPYPERMEGAIVRELHRNRQPAS